MLYYGGDDGTGGEANVEFESCEGAFFQHHDMNRKRKRIVVVGIRIELNQLFSCKNLSILFINCTKVVVLENNLQVLSKLYPLQVSIYITQSKAVKPCKKYF